MHTPASLTPRAAELFGDVPPTKARILEAALDLFVERGFYGTSVPELARRSGLATGTLYLHFANKEALVNELLTRLKGGLARRVVQAYPHRSTTREQFLTVWGVLARFLTEYPRAVAFMDQHHHADYLTAETMDAWDPAARLLEGHFRAGRRAGVYRDLPPKALRAILAGVLIGLGKFARAGELKLGPALLERAAESAWAALTAPTNGSTA